VPQRLKPDTAKTTLRSRAGLVKILSFLLQKSRSFNLETLTVEKVESQEKINKSFDVLASVNLFRSDLEAYGRILPETKERVYDEELTFIAEGIDRPLYTAFEIKLVDGHLSYFHEGEWKPYVSTLITGLKTAQKEAEEDPRKAFLEQRAVEDLQKGYEFESMKPGETLVWHSPFPKEQQELYGDKFLKEAGFQPDRNMGFMYRAQKNEDGSLILESQSVDNSDEEAFSKIYETADNDPQADMDTLLRSYDGALKIKCGKEYRAGRIAGRDIEEEAWTFLGDEAQRKLLSHYFDEIENMAKSSASAADLERIKSKLTYGTWAAIKLRLDRENASFTQNTMGATQVYLDSAEEVRQGYLWAASRNELMPGCGGSIGAEDDISSMDPSDVRDVIFGKEKKNTYSFNKEMYCVVCQAPPAGEENKKMCGPCGICRDCDKKM
jgi:hypothetical protein